jgi:hypothetical protein
MPRRNKFFLIVLLFATLACMAIATEVPTQLPTVIVVTVAHITSPPSTSEAVYSVPSELPVFPTITESECQLRVEISTGSDWTNLEILNSEIVRAAIITAPDGEFTNHTAAPDLIAMNQTLENAKAGKTIKLQVDLYIDASANADKLEMILKKGSIGLATLRFYEHSSTGDTLIKEITHYLVEGDTSGLNALPFSIPLK